MNRHSLRLEAHKRLRRKHTYIGMPKGEHRKKDKEKGQIKKKGSSFPQNLTGQVKRNINLQLRNIG